MTININHHHYFHAVPQTPSEQINLLKTILTKTENIMSKTENIEAKVDALQTALDAEQAQIQTAIDELGALRTEVQTLREQLAQQGVDNAALDRIDAKIDSIKTDLEGTIADAPTEPTPEA
jgi:regulator of replication initiation timing